MCIFFSSLTLVLAITAVVLEGPKWRLWLTNIQLVDDQDTETKDEDCIITGMLSVVPLLLQYWSGVTTGGN